MALFDCTNIELKKNCKKGDNVIQLQRCLKTLGYYTRQVDGDFGYYTDKAVRAFQKKYGLKVDGIFGPVTCKKMNEVMDKTTTTTATQTKTITADGGVVLVKDTTPEYSKKETYKLVVYPDVVVLPESTTDSTGSVTKTGGSIQTETTFDCSKINLKKDDKGGDVTKLQTILKARGYYTRQIDGDFGKYTKKAVQQLQKAQGNEQTGIFDTQTCSSLQKTSTTSNLATGTKGTKAREYTITEFTTRPSISIDLEGMSYEVTVQLLYSQDLFSHIRKLQKTYFVYKKGTDTIIEHEGYINEIKVSNSDSADLIELQLTGYKTFLEQTIDIPEDKTGKKSELLKYFTELAGMKLNLDTTGLVDDTYTVKAQKAETSTSDGGGLTQLSGNDCTDTNSLSARSYDIDTCKGNTKIGNSNANYAQDTKHMTAKEAIMDVYNRFHYGPSLTSDRTYLNNRRCPQEMWSKTGKFWGNCADVSRLVKAVGEVHGMKIGIRHMTLHYYNLIEVDGKVYKFDCCCKSTGSYNGEVTNNLTKRGGPWSG